MIGPILMMSCRAHLKIDMSCKNLGELELLLKHTVIALITLNKELDCFLSSGMFRNICL